MSHQQFKCNAIQKRTQPHAYIHTLTNKINISPTLHLNIRTCLNAKRLFLSVITKSTQNAVEKYYMHKNEK